jgi:hypothetical protein
MELNIKNSLSKYQKEEEVRMSETFEQNCIVELFGRTVIAGKVSEQVIGGKGFIRVDVPEVDDIQGFTKFFGPEAVYAITPCDESTMMLAVQGLHVKPIQTYSLGICLPALNKDEDLEQGSEDVGF